MKNELITIIIPCYNSEMFIKKCLDSIMNQTYKNIEIIVVDDCSSDNSVNIIKKFVNKNNNISLLINKSNHGAGYSRNIALKKASGQYISFVDIDDYIDNNYIEKMYNAVKKNNSEIAISDIKIIHKNNIELNVSGVADDVYSYLNNGLSAAVWNKMIKRDLVINRCFNEEEMNEDISFMLPLICSSKICHCDDTYYYYVQHSNSMQNEISLKRFNVFSQVDQAIKLINNKELDDLIIYNQLFFFLIYSIIPISSKKNRKMMLKRYASMISKYRISNNKYVQDFISNCGRLHRVFYKLVIVLLNNKNIFLLNTLITISQLYINKIKKPVYKSHSLKDLNSIRVKKYDENFKKISVVVPNYNYKEFLIDRMYTILYQKYPIFEIIILDDCSTDNSDILITEIIKIIEKKVNVKYIKNNENSGSVSKQWLKGFEEACGDYIWIAEADDLSKKKFLDNLIKKDSTIIYSNSIMIDENNFKILNDIRPLIDLNNSNHWSKSFSVNGKSEVENYMYLNCTIPNVSSCIIKNNDYSKFLKVGQKYKQVGDWYFYLNVLLDGGTISFINKKLNYYRVHSKNVSSSVKKTNHLKEIISIYDYEKQSIDINKKKEKNMNNRINYLKKVWKIK